MSIQNILVIFLGLLAFHTIVSKPIYDFKKSHVNQLTGLNFKDQLQKIRQNTNYVSVVHFYKQNDGASVGFVAQFDKWANEFDGVYRIGSMDCQQYEKLCKDQNIKQFPTFKVYPPIPIPPTDITEDITIEKIQKTASKYLHSNIIDITASNLQTLLGQNPSVPKVLLFTDKKGIPSIYKGLSVAFQKKLTFGIVKNTEQSLVSKYMIKKFPSLIVIKTGQKRPFYYNGKQFNFREIFQFLNIYSQVFVPGGGSSLDSSATKQWMTQSFPQMYDKSAKDICLGNQGVLCVILITNQKPNKDQKQQFEQLNSKFETKLDRGVHFKFMWLNALIEKKWGELFGYKGLDKVVVLNPGKRKRFTDHEGPIQKESISETLDAISGGNARFNRISELPLFELRT